MNLRRDMKHKAPRPPARGMALIEVLVAVLLFSIGLLGLLGLQTRAVQYSVQAEDQNRAALLAADLGAAMLAQGNLNVDAATLLTWQQRVADPAAGGLPNGAGAVAIAGNLATITVSWRQPAARADTSNRYVTQVVAP